MQQGAPTQLALRRAAKHAVTHASLAMQPDLGRAQQAVMSRHHAPA